jgi:lysophospholipase L1-like esterase
MERPERRKIILGYCLGISLAVNAVLVPVAGYWLHMRGGLKYFSLAAVKGNTIQSSTAYRRALYDELDGTNPRPASTIMFGDSLTAAGLWPEWYESTVLNRGIYGENTSDALQRVSDITSSHPAKIFILFGVNDYGVLPAERTTSNMQAILTELHTRSPGSEIYLESLLPPPTLAREDWVLRVNASFKHLAEEHHLHWINLYPLFVAGRVMNRKLTVDGVHLTGQGYDVWRKAIQPYVLAQGVSATIKSASK